jgi:hypothetical protein
MAQRIGVDQVAQGQRLRLFQSHVVRNIMAVPGLPPGAKVPG